MVFSYHFSLNSLAHLLTQPSVGFVEDLQRETSLLVVCPIFLFFGFESNDPSMEIQLKN